MTLARSLLVALVGGGLVAAMGIRDLVAAAALTLSRWFAFLLVLSIGSMTGHPILPVTPRRAKTAAWRED